MTGQDPSQRWIHAAKALTMLSVLAIVGGLYLGLQWSEAEQPRSVLWTETLQINYEAPATHDQGPWHKGYVFDRTSLGVPLDLASEWQVIATYKETGLSTEEGEWRSNIEIRQSGPGGRSWWTQQNPRNVTIDGDQGSIRLNMSRMIEKAQELKAEADVPGALQVVVKIHYVSTVFTDNGESTAMRTARLVVENQDGVLHVEAHDDRAEYQVPENKDPPVIAALFAGGGVLSGGMALFARNRFPKLPFENVVAVKKLKIPDHAVKVDAESLVQIARQRQMPVLLDREQGVFLIMDEIPIMADAPDDGATAELSRSHNGDHRRSR